MKKKNRINEVNYNSFGTKMKIIEYNSNMDIVVEFQDKYRYRKRTIYKAFREGKIKNLYDKTIYNIGYLGEGKYSNKKHEKIYDTWEHMLRRCYDPYHINKNLTYKDCFVCDEWHCFQNFAKWYEDNYYKVLNEIMHLDKDILIKGNKIYSPNTCIFVPQRINTLFVKNDVNRGKYPIGVRWEADRNKYRANCSIFIGEKKKIIVKRFDTEAEAFDWYKKEKENYIKQVAEEYKEFIPIKLYNAMHRYKVEIND